MHKDFVEALLVQDEEISKAVCYDVGRSPVSASHR